ncbi:MAG: hypothetical protein FWH34_01520 [Desulfovibrionaceae bacterium]|nr:hypothetical protein [Desulfovibrionaceae bacterium]
MNIAYIADVGSQSHGVMQKVSEQTSAWAALGHEARLFCVSPPSDPRYAPWARYNLLNPRRAVLSDLTRFKPDMLYWREEGFSAFTLALLLMFAKRTVIEINSSSIHEGRLFLTKSFSHKRAHYTHILSQPLVARTVLGLACVTEELALAPEFARQPNRFVGPNGISLAGKTLMKKTDQSGPTRIVFLGSPGQPWHGVDKLPALAGALGGGFQFHLAGPRAEDISSDKSMPDNIIVHGYLDASACGRLMADAHIGMGTMALHRKNMEEACPLKTREYIAAGLPVILPYRDTAFGEKTPDWILPLPNREDAFEYTDAADAVRAFCEAQKNRIVTHEESRPYIEITSLEAKKLAAISRWLRRD